jgi:hypothetical protein
VHGLIRYAFPNGSLPAMIWRQRMGANMKGDGKCRAVYLQIYMQLFLTGGNHASGAALDQSSIGTKYPLFSYCPRRGIVIARSDASSQALYTHFDARPDAFLLGHDNADRGIFVISALGKTWVQELSSWRQYPRSEHHSLLHMDELAQSVKSPSVRMLKAEKSSSLLFMAAADLSTAYNYQWHPAWPNSNASKISGWSIESRGPTDFGWPVKPDGKALLLDGRSIEVPSNLRGDSSFGFDGMFTYVKTMQVNPIKYVRSTVLHRGDPSVPHSAYFMVVDKVRTFDGKLHNFTFQAIMAADVYLISSECLTNKVVLGDSQNSTRRMDVHIVSSLGSRVYYGFEDVYKVDSAGDLAARRFVIGSANLKEEELWIAFRPRVCSESPCSKLTFTSVDGGSTSAGRIVSISIAGGISTFGLGRDLSVKSLL